jgi:hypothetical protein
MKGKISVLIKSEFNEYVNAEHVIAMKVSKNGNSYAVRVYTKTSDLLGVYEDEKECNETVTRLERYLSTYGAWIQAGEYLFKADAIESICDGGKSVDVKIENKVFSIPYEDESQLEAILDKIEKGFCGAVFNM